MMKQRLFTSAKAAHITELESGFFARTLPTSRQGRIEQTPKIGNSGFSNSFRGFGGNQRPTLVFQNGMGTAWNFLFLKPRPRLLLRGERSKFRTNANISGEGAPPGNCSSTQISVLYGGPLRKPPPPQFPLPAKRAGGEGEAGVKHVMRYGG